MLTLSGVTGMVRGTLSQCPLHTCQVGTVAALAQFVFAEYLGSAKACAPVPETRCAQPLVTVCLSVFPVLTLLIELGPERLSPCAKAAQLKETEQGLGTI